MLDLDPKREGIAPRDDATIILLRDTASGMEVVCAKRNTKSRFLGGAIVFPGRRVEDADREGATGEDDLLRVAACRETLEEAAIPIASGGAVSNDDVQALRERAKTDPTAIRAFLLER